MFNETIVVTVTPFSGTTTPDKNGEPSVMLQCIAGKMPNRNVLAGTVANRAGFFEGKTYLANVRETGEDLDFGLQFNWLAIKEVTDPVDVVKLIKELGAPQIEIIPIAKGYKDWYERKGNAIESSITQRIKEGKFKPSTPRSINHKDAAEVIAGSSQDSLNRIDESELKNRK